MNFFGWDRFIEVLDLNAKLQLQEFAPWIDLGVLWGSNFFGSGKTHGFYGWIMFWFYVIFFVIVVEKYESMSHLHFNKGDWLEESFLLCFFYHHWSSVMSCFYRVETEVTALPHSSRVPHGNLWTHRWTPACSTVQSLDNGTSWHLGWADVIGTQDHRMLDMLFFLNTNIPPPPSPSSPSPWLS